MTQRITPTHRRLLKVLGDGEPHTREELMTCLSDELGNPTNVNVHLARLRPLLRAQGEDVLCVWTKRQRMYQWIKKLVFIPLSHPPIDPKEASAG